MDHNTRCDNTFHQKKRKRKKRQYTVEPSFSKKRRKSFLEVDKTGAVWRHCINIIHVDVVDFQVFKKVKKGHIPAIKTKSKGIEWKSLIFK